MVGTLVLAGVTSLPNAVAAVYLARRGRGAASLSTAMNSNALNVAAGLLLPAVILGIGPATASVTLVAAWYVGLTVLVVAFAYLHRGLRRRVGILIVTAYLVFAATLAATAPQSPTGWTVYVLPAAVILALSSVLLIWPRQKGESSGDPASARLT